MTSRRDVKKYYYAALASEIHAYIFATTTVYCTYYQWCCFCFAVEIKICGRIKTGKDEDYTDVWISSMHIFLSLSHTVNRHIYHLPCRLFDIFSGHMPPNPNFLKQQTQIQHPTDSHHKKAILQPVASFMENIHSFFQTHTAHNKYLLSKSNQDTGNVSKSP